MSDGLISASGKSTGSSLIFIWPGVLLIAAMILAFSYFIYFSLILGQPASIDADKWGQFGDFFGGILNPIVAFAAFYWVRKSVLLQKKEMRETSQALADAARSQSLIVRQGRKSVMISGYTALASAEQSRLDLANQKLESLKSEKLAVSRFKNEGNRKQRIANDIEYYEHTACLCEIALKTCSDNLKTLLEEEISEIKGSE